MTCFQVDNWTSRSQTLSQSSLISTHTNCKQILHLYSYVDSPLPQNRPGTVGRVLGGNLARDKEDPGPLSLAPLKAIGGRGRPNEECLQPRRKRAIGNCPDPSHRLVAQPCRQNPIHQRFSPSPAQHVDRLALVTGFSVSWIVYDGPKGCIGNDFRPVFFC